MEIMTLLPFSPKKFFCARFIFLVLRLDKFVIFRLRLPNEKKKHCDL